MNFVLRFIIIIAGGIGLGIALATARIVNDPPAPTPIVEAYPAPVHEPDPGGYPAPVIGDAISITVTPELPPPPPVWGPTPTSAPIYLLTPGCTPDLSGCELP